MLGMLGVLIWQDQILMISTPSQSSASLILAQLVYSMLSHCQVLCIGYACDPQTQRSSTLEP